ncbi:MAG: hypothetical protein J6P73_08630 [Bacteroidales bacterium]|nr:hypothetical protein [Bacteroidales bacterium]
MKTVLPYIKTFGVLIAAYLVFAVVSCLLPDKAIKRHIAESVPVVVKEGLYPQAIIGVEQCQMDNFTDALIMNQIYNIDRKHPLKSAMRMIRSSEDGRDWDQPGLLLRRVNGETLQELHYARYWHGGSFLFRPFFLLMDFITLRFVLFIISSILLVMLLCAYYPKAGLMKTLALAMGFLMTYGFVTQFSMQFFPVLALTIIGCLMILKRSESADFGLLFFVIGSLVCYFDLLTTPLLTLGIPLAVMLSLKEEDYLGFKDNLLKISKLILLWGAGFALTFVTKWAMASLVLGQNIFADAYGVSLYRMEADDFSRWEAVTKNLGMINWWMVGIAAAIFLIFNLIKYRKFHYQRMLLFLIIALMPYVWYLLLANHSYLHWWFTYRLQAVTVVCLLIMFGKNVSLHGLKH